MSKSHNERRCLLALLFLGSVAVALAGCGPELIPEATLEPPAEVAQLQPPAATPTSTPGQFQSPISTPGPTNTFPPPPTVTPEPPTPTIPPVPTPRPTPRVTPIPTAAPPIIALPAGQMEAPYLIAYRSGNVVHSVRSDGTDEQVLLDVHAQAPLYLVSQEVGADTWGSPSSDGSQLALVLSNVENRTSLAKGEEPVYGIYVFDLATKQLRPLVEEGVEPVWSPDDTRIAYRSTRTSGLWIVDVASGERSEIYPVDRQNEHVAINFDWSPDGRQLILVDNVFRQSSTMVVVAADGSGFTPVVLSPNDAELFFPQWSPNGDKILYSSLRGESSGPDYPYNVWIMNADGSGQTQLTRDISVAGIPCWSPNGDWISFTGTQYYEEREPFIDLWLIDRVGNELKRVTSNEVHKRIETKAVWSPEGTQLIHFVADLNEVWTLSLDDGVQTELPSVTPDFIILLSAEY